MSEIYLDHAATTPLRPESRDAMLRVESEAFGNPSSTHRWGRAARQALEEARERVAAAIGARRRDIVFTGGGSEADNLAVLGRWRAARRAAVGGGPVAVACSAVEHKAVLGAAAAAEREGAVVALLPVDGAGRLDLAALDETLAELGPSMAVLAVMWGNNEVGTIQPVAEAAERCRAAGVPFHTDAVQAMGRTPVSVESVHCDLLALTAHKIGGPKGIGALYVRDGIELEPLLHGGGQEGGLRAGTQAVAAAVGLATAVELAVAELESEPARLATLRDRLESALRASVPDLMVNGSGAERLPHVLNVSLPSVDQEALLMSLDLEGLSVSSGSACQSGVVEPSHVLVAMGQGTSANGASVRMSLGRSTTTDEVDRAATLVPRVVERLRSMSAL